MEVVERLLKEVELSVQCTLQLLDVIGKRNFQVHLDVNPSAEYKSNKILSSAIGYVKSIGVEYQIKPHAFAASTAADYLLH